MGTYLLALVVCALVFGGLLRAAEGMLFALGADGTDALDAILRSLTLATTLLVPALWTRRALRNWAGFWAGVTVGALATGPFFLGLAATGRMLHP